MSSPLQPRWCVAANIVRERPYGPLGLERRSGTRHFRAGAKVWVIDWFAGMCTDVVVVGRHRGSRRLVKMALRVSFTESWRPQIVYSPTVLEILREHFGKCTPLVTTEEEAKETCRALALWKEGLLPRPIHEPGQVVAHVSGNRARVRPFLDGQAGVLDPSRHWDIPVTLSPEHLSKVGHVVLVDRRPDGELTIGELDPSK